MAIKEYLKEGEVKIFDILKNNVNASLNNKRIKYKIYEIIIQSNILNDYIINNTITIYKNNKEAITFDYRNYGTSNSLMIIENSDDFEIKNNTRTFYSDVNLEKEEKILSNYVKYKYINNILVYEPFHDIQHIFVDNFHAIRDKNSIRLFPNKNKNEYFVKPLKENKYIYVNKNRHINLDEMLKNENEISERLNDIKEELKIIMDIAKDNVFNFINSSVEQKRDFIATKKRLFEEELIFLNNVKPLLDKIEEATNIKIKWSNITNDEIVDISNYLKTYIIEDSYDLEKIDNFISGLTEKEKRLVLTKLNKD